MTLQRLEPALPARIVPPRTPAPVIVRASGAAGRLRRGRRGPILFVVALLLAALVGSLAWWFGVGRYTATPSVIGLSQTAAAQKLHDAGLTTTVGAHAYSETVPKDRVISTDPNPGQKVRDGGAVSLTISLGKERYSVPTLRGKTVDEAQDAILASHLSFGRAIERYSGLVAAGTVLGSDPAAGTSLKPNTAVDIFVSKGPKPITIPDFTNQDAKKAEKALKDLGFKVETTKEHSDTVAKGLVISQDPHEGDGVRHDTIRLVVSDGPDKVQIPGGLVASGVESAKATLEGLGFVVNVQNAPNYLGLGYVYSVSPGEGQMADYGSTVTLFLI